MENGKMRKESVIGILASLMLCGCQKEAVQSIEEIPVPQTFTVSIGEDATKTVLGTGDNAGKVLWQAGDEVSVWPKYNGNYKFKVDDKSAGKSTGTLKFVSSPGESSYTSISFNIAYYPYSESNKLTSNSILSYTITTSLPSEQTYVENSFASGVFPMVGSGSALGDKTATSDRDIEFKNVLGGVKLQLKGTAKIAKIVFSGNNGESICNAAEVTYNRSNNSWVPGITMKGTADEDKTVTLNCGDGVQLNSETVTSFIIALPPMEMSKGYTFKVYDTNDRMMEFTTKKSKTIKRSVLLKMPVKEYDPSKQPFTITAVGSTSLQFTKIQTSAADITLNYSKDGDTWTEYTVGESVSLEAGEKVQFRAGDAGNTSLGDYRIVVTGSGSIKASGNIMSLLDKTMSATAVTEKAFYQLFLSCSKLTDASNLILPATTLAKECYRAMFSGCTGLTSAPKLPATTLAGICYREMFYNCKSLTSAPELPATVLAGECYYGMFQNCTSLTSAPILPAQTLETRSYYTMFNGCSNLNYIKALFTEWPDAKLGSTHSWVDGVASEGTFVMSSKANWKAADHTGTDGVPTGWNVTTE